MAECGPTVVRKSRRLQSEKPVTARRCNRVSEPGLFFSKPTARRRQIAPRHKISFTAAAARKRAARFRNCHPAARTSALASRRRRRGIRRR